MVDINTFTSHESSIEVTPQVILIFYHGIAEALSAIAIHVENELLVGLYILLANNLLESLRRCSQDSLLLYQSGHQLVPVPRSRDFGFFSKHVYKALLMPYNNVSSYRFIQTSERDLSFMGKDFSKMTDSQLMRDRAVLNEITKKLVSPLLYELSVAVRGYADMSDREKYVSLLMLNEEHAKEGDSLLVDFGSINGTDTLSSFFAGESIQLERHWDGARQYTPLYIDSEHPGFEHNGSLAYNNLLLYDEDGLEQFSKLPICFRLAAIARTIQQNLLVTRKDACRYAAGFDDDLHLTRWRARPLESGYIQRFGWYVEIRDTKPENELLREIARRIRVSVNSYIDSYEYIPTEDGNIPLYAESNEPRQHKRTRHASTENLVGFIDLYLPSIGLYVGRSGVGKRISWKEAFEIFNDEYPGIYNSEKSFRDSYYNAKKARQYE